MKFSISKLIKGAVIGAIAIYGSSSLAGVLMGDTVKYTVSDETSLFGMPTIKGDTLMFEPTDFLAKSLNGEGADLANETIKIEVESLNGQNLLGASLKEGGDYLKFDFSGGTNQVNVTGQLRAGAMFDAIEPIAPFNSTALATQPWEADASLDLTGKVTNKTTLLLENILVAISNSTNDIALIQKKFVALDVTAVPIPAAAWLLGTALVGLVLPRALRKKP